jgi:hypothetical protein
MATNAFQRRSIPLLAPGEVKVTPFALAVVLVVFFVSLVVGNGTSGWASYVAQHLDPCPPDLTLQVISDAPSLNAGNWMNDLTQPFDPSTTSGEFLSGTVATRGGY